MEQLTKAVKAAVPDAQVLSTSVVQMEITVFVWDNSLSTWMPAAVLDTFVAVLIGLVFVFVILLVFALIWCLGSHQAPPQALPMPLPRAFPDVHYQKLKQ
jgi:hypothetical protein